MIEISKITKADIGRGVVYYSSGGDKTEEGVVSSWNDTFIFVRYGDERQAKATNPKDLEWEFLLSATPKSTKKEKK